MTTRIVLKVPFSVGERPVQVFESSSEEALRDLANMGVVLSVEPSRELFITPGFGGFAGKKNITIVEVYSASYNDTIFQSRIEALIRQIIRLTLRDEGEFCTLLFCFIPALIL